MKDKPTMDEQFNVWYIKNVEDNDVFTTGRIKLMKLAFKAGHHAGDEGDRIEAPGKTMVEVRVIIPTLDKVFKVGSYSTNEIRDMGKTGEERRYEMEFVKAEKVPVIPKFVKPLGTLGVDWHVFDDHVSINENVIIGNGEGGSEPASFSLKVWPVGEVEILRML